MQVTFELTGRSQLWKKSGLEHLGSGNRQSPQGGVSLTRGWAVSASGDSGWSWGRGHLVACREVRGAVRVYPKEARVGIHQIPFTHCCANFPAAVGWEGL